MVQMLDHPWYTYDKVLYDDEDQRIFVVVENHTTKVRIYTENDNFARELRDMLNTVEARRQQRTNEVRDDR